MNYKKLGKTYFTTRFNECKKVIEDGSGEKKTFYSSWIAVELAQKDGIELKRRNCLENFMIGFEQERNRIMY